MKCVVVKAYGEALDNLAVEERVDVAPGPDEIAVDVAATALNRADLLQRRGLYPAPPDSPEYVRDIPGLEFVGRVSQAGEHVKRWRGGERVAGILSGGGYASRVIAHQDLVFRVPDDLSDTEAAAVPEAFITAFDALVLQCKVSRGERVLVHAVASGVGTAAVQLVGAWGAEAVGTAGSDTKLQRVAEFARFFAVNYRTADFREQIEKRFGETPVDVVLDVVGASYWPANLVLLRAGGRLVLVGRLGGSDAQTPLGLVMSKRLHIIGTVMRSRTLEQKIAVTQAFADEVLPLFKMRVLKPVVDSVFPFEDVQKATARMERNENVGKIVLKL